MQNTKAMSHFARHVLLVSKVHAQKQKAEDDVYGHLDKMKRLIIRMSLSYKDIDRLKEKINLFIDTERKYAKFFSPDDGRVKELKDKIIALEQEIQNEKEEKYRIVSENDERIKEMSDSLQAIKHKMRVLHVDRAKRQRKFGILEEKINNKVDRDEYFSS